MDNINVIEILKLGFPGLVFLMSVLTYRLIVKEQAKEKPNSEVIRLIRHYRDTSLLFAVLTVASPIVENYFFSAAKPSQEYQQIPVTAVVDSGDLQQGIARVCQEAFYHGRYLLVTDADSRAITQVHASQVLGCGDNTNKIVLSQHDSKNFNWSDDQGQVYLMVANKGQRYIMNNQ